MIVILCDSEKEACEKFDLFIMVLEENEPWCITRSWPECNCVETDSDLKYLFIDYRYGPFFEKRGEDVIDEDEFLFGIDEMYEIGGRF